MVGQKRHNESCINFHPTVKHSAYLEDSKICKWITEKTLREKKVKKIKAGMNCFAEQIRRRTFYHSTTEKRRENREENISSRMMNWSDKVKIVRRCPHVYAEQERVHSMY